MFKNVWLAGLVAVVAVTTLSSAKAATETWDFSSPTGALGTTQNYSSTPDGLIATVSGFLTGSPSPIFPPSAGVTAGNLFGKNAGTDSSGSIEKGVGLQSPAGDTSGQNEIQAGTSFVRVALPTGLTNIFLTVNSATSAEHYEIFGSTSATSGYSLIVFNATAQGTPIDVSTPCPLCTFFALFAVGVQTPGSTIPANVLLGAASGQFSAVPLPPAALLFGTALVGMTVLGRRRKQKEFA